MRYRGNEPTPAASDGRIPRRPKWLKQHGPEAIRCWDYTAPRLGRMGVLSALDRDALLRYCVLWSQWRQAVDYIAEHGPTVERIVARTDEGTITEVKDHPAVARGLRLNEQLTKIGARFGLTPSDRANMATPERKQEQTLEDILGLGGRKAK